MCRGSRDGRRTGFVPADDGEACSSGDLASAFASMTVDGSVPSRAFSTRLDDVDPTGNSPQQRTALRRGGCPAVVRLPTRCLLGRESIEK